MKNNLNFTFEEYKALRDTYQSEGYAIMVRTLDAKIGLMFNSIMKADSNSDILGYVNQIKGMKVSKELIFNLLKEGEADYENKRT